MILFLLYMSAFAIPPIAPLKEVRFPNIYRSTTSNGERIIWVEKEQEITEIEVFFSQGGEEDFEHLRWVTHHWESRAKKYERELIRLGAYLRFSMRASYAYAQVRVIEGKEKEALNILKRVLVHIPSRMPASRSKERLLPWSMEELISTVDSHEESNDLITRTDKRRAYRTWKNRSQPRYIVIGKRPIEELSQLFDGFWSKPSRTAQRWRPKKRIWDWKSKKVLVDRKMGTQAEVFVYVPLPTVDAHTKTLWNRILGGAFSSRLSFRFRQELGMVYSISSSVHRYGNQSCIEIVAQVSYEDLLTFRDELYHVILSMKEISSDELVRAKRQEESRDRTLIEKTSVLLAWLRYHDDFSLWHKERSDRNKIQKNSLQSSMGPIFRGGDNIWIIHGEAQKIAEIYTANWSIFPTQ